MKNKVKIDKDILACIRGIRIAEGKTADGSRFVGVEEKRIIDFGGSNACEDIAMALGLTDMHYQGTEIDADGMLFPKDLTDRFMEIYGYVSENIVYIEQIIHQFAAEGGVTEGVYESDGSDSFIWRKIS